MDYTDFKLLVDKALLNYDKQNKKNKNILLSKKYLNDIKKNELFFSELNKTFTYNILGIFDNIKKIWIWGWLSPNYYTNEIQYTKKLLDYGIKISPDETDIKQEKLYLKSQFTNSRFLLNDIIQLELHLALSSYLLKDNFDFIYPVKKYLDNKDKENYISIFYILKEK
jgi:hypothetical protein